MSNKDLFYLCLQASQEGQASHAHVREIITGLDKRGWRVSLYEPKYANTLHAPRLINRLLGITLAQVKMWLQLARKKPSVLYIRSHFASWPSAILARMLGVPVVQEVNGTYEDLFIAWPWTRRLAKLFIWAIRTQLRKANAVIAVTPQLSRWAEGEGAKDTYVIPNAANIRIFHPGATIDGGLQLPDKYVVFFGALAPWQGINTMLKAVRDASWPNEVSLVIVGDGVERMKVEKAARRTDKIVYLGRQPYLSVPGIVARSIAGLSPQCDAGRRSLDTGLFPLKVFETMACGVPVVVSDFPGMADLVREAGCGIVIQPENHRELAESVRYLYENPQERELMGRRGIGAVIREHSWDKRAEDTSKILESMMSSFQDMKEE